MEQKQNIKVMNREMLKIGLTGSIAGAVFRGNVYMGYYAIVIRKKCMQRIHGN